MMVHANAENSNGLVSQRDFSEEIPLTLRYKQWLGYFICAPTAEFTLQKNAKAMLRSLV